MANAIRMTKIRAFIGAVVAVIMVIVLAAFAALAMDVRVPILSNITDTLGF